MIIWGWKQYAVLLVALTMACERCGTHAEQAVYKVTTKFTLFWIPLFPVGVKHLVKCSACGQEQKIPKERAQQLAAGGAQPAPPMGQPAPPQPPMNTGPRPAVAPGMAPGMAPGPRPPQQYPPRPYAPPPGPGYGPPQGTPPGQQQPPWGPR